MLCMSACLAGINCKYSGGNNYRKECAKRLWSDEVLLICPEVITDLGCPRLPAEIQGLGGGDGVWQGTARVINSNGEDITEEFKAGALATLEKIKEAGDIELVVLQSRSPSCGVNTIYDGTFSKQMVVGDGVFVSLLKQHGIPVIDVDDFIKKG